MKIFGIFAALRNTLSMLKIGVYLIPMLLALVQPLSAQEKVLVEGSSPILYVVHTVVARENWYSVGRLYNINPKELAPYNRTNLAHPLAIGQILKIPLKTSNFSQDGNKAADEVFVPLYHIVQEKEWMYRISTNHNKVPIENLEKWNNTNNARLKAGMAMIVGYLKVKRGLSALASSGTRKISNGSAPLAQDDEANKKPTPVQVVKEEYKKPETEETVKTEIKEETKPMNTITFSNYRGGYFRSQYMENGKGVAGNAGVFRSTSGWKDGKYYALMNNVPVGTIVKVTFTSTNKSVYAKVLGQLPEMRESMGLKLRISDAAATVLGVENNKFYVDVKY